MIAAEGSKYCGSPRPGEGEVRALAGVTPFCPERKAPTKQPEPHKNLFSPLAHGRSALQNVQHYCL